jgi:hypothetical protein
VARAPLESPASVVEQVAFLFLSAFSTPGPILVGEEIEFSTFDLGLDESLARGRDFGLK